MTIKLNDSDDDEEEDDNKLIASHHLKYMIEAINLIECEKVPTVKYYNL